MSGDAVPPADDHLAARLLALTDAALAHLALDDLLDALLGRVRDLLDADTVAVLLLDEQSDELVTRAAKGLEGEVEQGVRIPVGRGVAGRIARERRALVIEDLRTVEVLSPMLRERGVRSLLGVPLVVQGRVTGVLHVGTLRSRRFTDDDARLLQLAADRVALAIDHAGVYEQTKAALAVRDQFLSIASHELRTPLTSLRGFLQMGERYVRRGELAQTERMLALGLRQVERLNGLIAALLDVTRIAEGRLRLERREIPVVPALARLLDVAQTLLPGRDVRLDAPDASPVVFVDPARLEQVFTNLLDNARKYSPDGAPIDLSVSTTADEVSVAVTDRGIGIPPEDRAAIFERFYRARNVDGGVSGLGLGLHISRQIVQAHGGRLTVASTPGQGSTFTVTLPLAAGPE